AVQPAPADDQRGRDGRAAGRGHRRRQHGGADSSVDYHLRCSANAAATFVGRAVDVVDASVVARRAEWINFHAVWGGWRESDDKWWDLERPYLRCVPRWPRDDQFASGGRSWPGTRSPGPQPCAWWCVTAP